jgi:hypothetical protein
MGTSPSAKIEILLAILIYILVVAPSTIVLQLPPAIFRRIYVGLLLIFLGYWGISRGIHTSQLLNTFDVIFLIGTPLIMLQLPFVVSQMMSDYPRKRLYITLLSLLILVIYIFHDPEVTEILSKFLWLDSRSAPSYFNH